MNRRTALATAAAITMTLFSGVVALGANTGALGLGGSPAPAVAQPIAAPTAAAPVDTASVARAASTTRSASAREHEQARGHEREGRESDD